MSRDVRSDRNGQRAVVLARAVIARDGSFTFDVEPSPLPFTRRALGLCALGVFALAAVEYAARCRKAGGQR